jgi:ATP-dependent DNA ligase
MLSLGNGKIHWDTMVRPGPPRRAPRRRAATRLVPTGGIPRVMLSRSPSWHPAGFIEPCLPTPSLIVPVGAGWAFELKHDGYRFVARRDGDRVRVFSRHAKDWTDKVRAIVEGMLALPVSATVDGEGVRVRRAGRHRFRAPARPPGWTRRLSSGVLVCLILKF